MVAVPGGPGLPRQGLRLGGERDRVGVGGVSRVEDGSRGVVTCDAGRDRGGAAVAGWRGDRLGRGVGGGLDRLLRDLGGLAGAGGRPAGSGGGGAAASVAET